MNHQDNKSTDKTEDSLPSIGADDLKVIRGGLASGGNPVASRRAEEKDDEDKPAPSF